MRQTPKPTAWNGIQYESISQAAKANDISPTTLRRWLNAPTSKPKRPKETALNLIGAKIKQLRLAKGWSQTELAQRSGLCMGTIATIERGKKNPFPQTLQKMARALGVQPSDLLTPNAPDTPLSFGKRIQQLRIERGWTTQQLADQMHVTLRAIHLREQRDTVPQYSTLMAYASIFGVKAEDIYKYPEKQNV